MQSILLKTILFPAFMLALIACNDTKKVKGEFPRIFLNEVMSWNESTKSNHEGMFLDWVEIYNDESHSVNLEGYFLSDARDKAKKWRFPAVEVGPHKYRVIFLEGRKETTDNLHASFRLNAKGEEILLSNPQGMIIDLLPAVELRKGQSLCRVQDGSNEFGITYDPTPGKSNSDDNILNRFRYNWIIPSALSGYYEEAISITLNKRNNEDDVHYTLDGSDPTTSSPRYEKPIVIDSSMRQPRISMIPTTAMEGPEHLKDFIWKPPQKVFMATVLKFRSFYDGNPSSDIFSHSYFIHPELSEKYSFPVISIITDSNYLFSHDSGFYVPGATFEESGWGGGDTTPQETINKKDGNTLRIFNFSRPMVTSHLPVMWELASMELLEATLSRASEYLLEKNTESVESHTLYFRTGT